MMQTFEDLEEELRKRDVCEVHLWTKGTSFDAYSGAPFNVTLQVRGTPLEFMGETLAEALADIDDWKAGRPRRCDQDDDG